jgi:hypothetical protein
MEMYAFRWNTRRNGAVYLRSLEDYAQGQQVGEAFTTDLDDAILFDSVTDAVAGIQERALNIDDVNSKLELVEVQGGGLTVVRVL